MARHLRVEYPGAIYHITSRGNERSNIFGENEVKRRFLEKLGESVIRYHARLYAYVVMTNHYHLLLETPRANVAAFMQQLNTSYTMYYNTRRERVGHVFSGRYKAKLVEGDAYLLALSRYLHLNPVKIAAMRNLPPAQRRARLGAYAWSSYRDYVGERKPASWLEPKPILAMGKEQFGGMSYRGYTETALAEDDKELREVLARSSKAVGDWKFCRWVQREYGKARCRNVDADVSMRRVEAGLEAKEVLQRVTAHFGVAADVLRKRRSAIDARLVAAKLLKELTGLTQRGVGQELGLKDGSGVGRLLALADRRLAKNRSARNAYKVLANALNP